MPRYRNYVPAGEDNTTSVRPRGERARNFIPGPDHDPGVRLTQEQQYEQAKADAKRVAQANKERRWHASVKYMAANSPSVLVGFLQELPMAQREMYLLAEELTANRREVLQYFPPAGLIAREVWGAVAGIAVVPEDAQAHQEEAPAPKRTRAKAGAE